MPEPAHRPGCHCLEFGCPPGIRTHGCLCRGGTMTDLICGAARTITTGNASAVLVCERDPSRHAGLDHRDLRAGISWPVCDSYCPATRAWRDSTPDRHRCGRYRGDTAAKYDTT